MRYRGPDGHECAAALTFDVDAESALIFREPERAARSLAANEERRFGVRTGVELDEEAEARVLDEQLDIWRSCLDLRPGGYRSPSWELNAGTPLLKSRGFVYDSSLMGDDIPYHLATPAGPLVEAPVQWLLDDAPMYRHVYGASNQVADPDRVIRMWAQEFDGMRRESGCFVLTMHPWISGRAGRLLGLEQLIQHMRRVPGVWFATVAEIAAWAARQDARIVHPAAGTTRP